MTEEQKEAIRAASRRPEVRLKKSLAAKEFYSDPKNREGQRIKALAVHRDPVKEKNRIEKLKEYYSNPENREKHRNAIKNAYKNPEYRKRLSESLKRSWMNKSDEEKERIRRNRAAANKREDVRAKNSISSRKHRIDTLEEILSRNKNPKRRSKEHRIRNGKYYGYRDRFYKMSHQINYDYIDQYITDAEIFIKYFSAIK